MNREIKFEIKFDRSRHYSGHALSSEGFVTKVYTLDELLRVENKFSISYKRQGTGLKDKNGVEIYEGDVLEAITRKGKFKWVIEYVDFRNYSGFVVYGENRRFHKGLTKNVIFNNECKVVGNIYES